MLPMIVGLSFSGLLILLLEKKKPLPPAKPSWSDAKGEGGLQYFDMQNLIDEEIVILRIPRPSAQKTPK